jgi:hypothetical protein
MKSLNPSSIKNIVIVVLIIIILLLGFGVGYYAHKNHVSEANYKAATDTLRVYKNKADEAVYQKTLYQLDIKQLKSDKEDLYKEIEKLTKKEQRQLVEISKLTAEIVFLKDSVSSIRDTSYKEEGSYKFDFCLQDEYRKIQGHNIVKSIEAPKEVFVFVDTNTVATDLVLMHKKTDRGIELAVSSSNPYLKINSIDGSIVNIDAYQKEAKKKHWGLGVGVGFGATYGLINKSIDVGPTVTVQVSYNFITW